MHLGQYYAKSIKLLYFIIEVANSILPLFPFSLSFNSFQLKLSQIILIFQINLLITFIFNSLLVCVDLHLSSYFLFIHFRKILHRIFFAFIYSCFFSFIICEARIHSMNIHMMIAIFIRLIVHLQEGRCLRTISDAHGHFITSLALSKAHPILLSGSVDKSIGIWSCS